MIVLPMLSLFSVVPCRCSGEFAEALSQVLQVCFLFGKFNHCTGTSYCFSRRATLTTIDVRDGCFYKLRIDSSRVVPQGFHFLSPRAHGGVYRKKFKWRDRRSIRPVQSYFVDFGLSHRYPTDNVPEHSVDTPYDPFKSDVYQLGDVILKVLADYEGIEAFIQLGRAMTSTNPDN
ncbi:hypothetical protein Hypma_002140 [Hypsizygus marmoreus]|uniref:Protein kinase domain-containing protein n=1 Tax=Hypsizygus marmoreus TaxID=39966 RepID=A0A369K7W5_HYPMA|nr:hypothetical protein Hypma_002140 [Hypsizygus marmoreus]